MSNHEDNLESNAELPKIVSNKEQLADAFYYYFSHYEEQFTIQYSGNTSDLNTLIEQATAIASKRDPFIEGHLSKREVQSTYSKINATFEVNQEYLITAEQAASVDATVDYLLENVNVSAMNDYEKVKYVNDFIVQNTVYSSDTTSTPHSAYTALAEGKAVCQGYALLAQKMLTKLGLSSLYVVGEAGGIAHAWNLVQVDGKWYHLDTTWDDPTPDRGKGVRYQYFLLSDQQLAQDHTWVKSDYPKATSNDYAYLHTISDSYEVGEYIYFSNDSEDNVLYRMNKTTKQQEKVSDIRVQYLTGEGEWIYFSNYSNSGYLSKMRLDGSDLTVLARIHGKNLYIENGYLIFSTDDGDRKIAL